MSGVTLQRSPEGPPGPSEGGCASLDGGREPLDPEALDGTLCSGEQSIFSTNTFLSVVLHCGGCVSTSVKS